MLSMGKNANFDIVGYVIPHLKYKIFVHIKREILKTLKRYKKELQS